MIELRGLDQFARDLSHLAGLARAPRNVLQPAADVLKRRIDRLFELHTDPYGVPWKPLAQSTLARKHGPGILEESGALRRSLWAEARDGQIRLGLSDFKAPFHQFGTKKRTGKRGRPPTRMPSRPMLPWRQGGGGVQLPDDWAAEVVQAIYQRISYSAFQKRNP